MRIGGLAAAFGIALVVHGAETKPTIGVTELPSPAGATATAPTLAPGPDRTVWLSWVEPATGAASVATIRLAAFSNDTRRWSDSRTIVADASVGREADDAPQVAIDGGGTFVAVWTDGHGGAFVRLSRDRGQTWTESKPWTQPATDAEKFSFATLADGRLLAVWLDGRNRQADGQRQQLFARVVGTDGSGEDRLVDPSVCDCCPTSVVPFFDGGALVGYRGRSDDEVRDIRVARWHENRWSEPRVPVPDNWHIRACPVNGPRLATDGSRLAAAWFTGADDDPRVEVTYSPDAGHRWVMPLRVDRGHPVGHVDTAFLRDGAIVVLWLEGDGSVWLRRITPDFGLTEPIALAPKGAAALSTFPRFALQRDYQGGHTEAQLLAAFAAKSGGVRVAQVTIPEGALLASERNCDCAPTPEELQGFPLQGTVVAIDPATNLTLIRHAEVPGVFGAGQHEFKISPLALATLHPGMAFLGRIDRRGQMWWLEDVRALGTPRP